MELMEECVFHSEAIDVQKKDTRFHAAAGFVADDDYGAHAELE
jgi:hypothetical protein